MSAKLEKRGERSRGISELEKDDAVLRNTEKERTSGMRSAPTGRRKQLSGVSWRRGCNQQKQSQMQSLMEANLGSVIKNLPIVRALPERNAA